MNVRKLHAEIMEESSTFDVLDSRAVQSGTSPVAFVGGPWDGRVTALPKDRAGLAERWDPDLGRAAIYRETGETVEVAIEHHKRAGIVMESRPAEVYEHCGHRIYLRGE